MRTMKGFCAVASTLRSASTALAMFFRIVSVCAARHTHHSHTSTSPPAITDVKLKNRQASERERESEDAEIGVEVCLFDDFDGVEIAGLLLPRQQHVSEGALADGLHDFKVLDAEPT